MDSASVLLVDDDRTSLVALTEVLRLRLPDVEVTTATSAATAFDRILKVNFDVIVTDVRMPIADGLGLLGAVRRTRPDTPVLLMSAYDDYLPAVQALRGGAYDLLQKPIDPDYFCRSLESALLLRWAKRSCPLLGQADAVAGILDGVRILVIDDNLDSLYLLTRSLVSFGAEVLAAESVSEALMLIEQRPPDVIVCDLRLPGEDGYSLMRKLQRRQKGRTQEIPAIAYTHYGGEEPRQQAIAAGFRTQLDKSSPPEVLVAMLASLTGRSSR